MSNNETPFSLLRPQKDHVERAVALKAAVPSIFSGLSAAPAASGARALPHFPAKATNLFNKPADAAINVSKLAETATSTNLFSNLGVISSAPSANTATTAAPSFGTFGTSASVPASATTTSVLFGSVPSKAPAEAPRAYLFGSDTATAPKGDFGAKQVPSTSFNFTSTARSAGLAANAFNSVAGGAKPSEPGNLFAKSATISAPSTGVTTPAIFTGGATITAAPGMSMSFPTTTTPFLLEGSSVAPITTMSQSFPPTTPQAPPPSMLFGGFKPQDTPTKHSPGNKFNEDISMASPEQSPEKPSPKTGAFGAATNGMANGNAFVQNKPFFSSAPSPLGKLDFQTATQPGAHSALNFRAPVSLPAVSMQTSMAPIASAPVNFNFGAFQSMPGAPTAGSTMAPSAAAPAPPFQFNAADIDLSLNSVAVRKRATPGGRRGGKR
ncbi:hypothetical protein BGX38DRAFT_1237719 [Terfezia claveryi]|nr:hypothetical protein BGX38DRAFT_1237719 [Terfezia claveryi]